MEETIYLKAQKVRTVKFSTLLQNIVIVLAPRHISKEQITQTMHISHNTIYMRVCTLKHNCITKWKCDFLQLL
jgi:IS30 family transposase